MKTLDYSMLAATSLAIFIVTTICFFVPAVVEAVLTFDTYSQVTMLRCAAEITVLSGLFSCPLILMVACRRGFQG